MIREVRISDHWEQALPLMRENWRETGFEFEFQPDLKSYQFGQDNGFVLALGCFDERENLVGYSTAVLTPHLFNPQLKFCATDALYLKPEHRGVKGALMICAMERLAKRRGANFIMWHTRAGTPLGEVMVKHGYTPWDTVVTKGL